MLVNELNNWILTRLREGYKSSELVEAMEAETRALKIAEPFIKATSESLPQYDH